MTGNHSAADIRIFIVDVDGVLTDGSLWYGESGEQLKNFNVRDGLSVALLKAHGVDYGLLSGRSSAPLESRIRHLRIQHFAMGRLGKLRALDEMLGGLGLVRDQVAYIGDDVVDLPLAGHVGRFYAPSDAHPLVLERADHVVSARGGRGAAREAAEHLLMESGLSLQQMWEPLIGEWERYDAAQ